MYSSIQFHLNVGARWFYSKITHIVSGGSIAIKRMNYYNLDTTRTRTKSKYGWMDGWNNEPRNFLRNCVCHSKRLTVDDTHITYNNKRWKTAPFKVLYSHFRCNKISSPTTNCQREKKNLRSLSLSIGYAVCRMPFILSIYNLRWKISFWSAFIALLCHFHCKRKTTNG